MRAGERGISSSSLATRGIVSLYFDSVVLFKSYKTGTAGSSVAAHPFSHSQHTLKVTRIHYNYTKHSISPKKFSKQNEHVNKHYL